MRSFFNRFTQLLLGLFVLGLPLLGSGQTPITATIQYQNEPLAGGFYQVFLKNTGPAVLTQPVIIVEGWDPLWQYTSQDIYDLVDNPGNNFLATRLRNEGYDVVVLNFGDGADYIQNNAFLLVKLILELNAMKNSNGSAADNVVVGVSMGGLVARYALRYMEQNNLDHDTRMMVTYDSPHQGANFPLGWQHLANHYLTNFPPVALPIYQLFLERPATRQMLSLYAYPGQSYNTTYQPVPHQDHTNFMQEIATMGYPSQPRKVAISMGSKRAQTQLKNNGINPLGEGDIIMFANYNFGSPSNFPIPRLIDKQFTIKAHGPAGTRNVFEILNILYGYVNGPIWNPNYAYVYDSRAYPALATPGYDYCPGGTNPVIGSVVDAVEGELNPLSFTVNYEENICFIPTISALDVGQINNDLFYDIGADEDIVCKLPFTGFYAQNYENKGHIDFPAPTANFIFNQIVDGSWEWKIDQSFRSFNFGVNSSNFIFQDVIVENTGLLAINKNESTDEFNLNSLYSPNIEPHPSNSSTFRVWTPTCGFRPEITVRNGGNLTLGDPNGNNGILELNDGAILRVGNNGTVTVFDESRLIVEEGAKLIVEPGATITLAGFDAVLEVDGMLEVMPGATLRLPGNGYMLFGNDDGTGPNIICHPGSAIEIEGNNSNHQKLVVKHGARFHPGLQLGNLAFKDCLVKLGEDATISTANADFSFEWVKVNALDPNRRHGGIFINGQANHTINGLNLEEGTVGITARQFWNQGAPLVMKNSDIHNCLNGIRVYDKGVNFTNVDVLDNTFFGYKHDGAVFYSHLNSGNYSRNGYTGVYFGSGGASLRFLSANADQNDQGVIFSGGGSLIPSCGSISSNTRQGITVSALGSLEMDNSRNGRGAQMVVANNEISIRLSVPDQVLLENGVNNLIPAVENVRKVITGVVGVNCAGSFVIPAPKNQWNSRAGSPAGAAPDPGLDLNVAGFGCPVIFTDLTPEGPPANCVFGFPYDPGDGGGFSGNTPLFGCTNCGAIRTASFPSTSLHKAVQAAIFAMEEFDSKNGDDLAALGLFEEILTYPMGRLTPEEEYLLDLAYVRMKTCFSNALTTGKVRSDGALKAPFPAAVAAMENVIQYRLSAALGQSGLPAGTDEEVTGLRLDAADVRYGLGLRNDALVLLDSALADTAHLPASVEFLDHMRGLRCLIATEQEVFAGTLNIWDFESALENCSGSGMRGRNKMTQGSGNGNASAIAGRGDQPAFPAGPASGSTLADGLTVEVFPNPSAGMFKVWLRSPLDGVVSLTLFAADGRQIAGVDGGKLVAGFGKAVQPDFGILSEGVYFLRVVVGDQVRMERVMIR